MPKAARPHIAAIYAFARMADDFADEGQAPAAERLARLEAWQWRLQEAAQGRVADGSQDVVAVFTALADTIQRFRLEVRLFEDLLSAFGQDVVVTRYETWDDLMDYCRRSANPVGRLVLRVNGYLDPAMDARSDAICTALQLTNFWQDLAVDFSRGRLYVPREFVHRAGAGEADLAAGRWTLPWQAALRETAGRTRALFDEGRPLAGAVRGRLRYELRATWLGGCRILDRLDRVEFDVFRARPSLGWRDAAAIGWQAFRWR
jgi:squalene synthase HpnC